MNMKHVLAKAFPVYLFLAIIALLHCPFSFAYEEEIKDISASMAKDIADAGKKTIAVADFTDLQGNVTELGRFLAEEFSVALAGAGTRFEVVDRIHLKSIIMEHKLSATGMIDPTTARKLGKIAGVQALITGTVTPFGDNVRVTVKILDTETAKIIGASTANIAKTKAIEELLSRGVESGQSYSSQPSSTSYVPSSGNSKSRIVEDSYLRIVVLNVTKSGNKFVNVRLVYENLIDKEMPIKFGYGHAAILFDNLGNKSQIHNSRLTNMLIPPKGKKQLGLGFEFQDAKELGKIFNLNVDHRTSPPGQVSFVKLVSE